MDVDRAQTLARRIHAGDRDRRGEPLIDHIERVAAAVPPEATAVAYLHEALEHSELSPEELAGVGLSALELSAVELLTHAPGAEYEQYVLAIAYAHGPAGALARTVKLADLADHLRGPARVGDPPYLWARQHIGVSSDRYDRAVVAA